MENQWIEGMLWIGVLLLLPRLLTVVRVAAKQIIYRIWPVRDVRIEHRENGQLIGSVDIKLDSKDPLVRQLATLRKDARGRRHV
ncbi:hypothetical protein [Gallaecimonas mangrovi]|uniref:hypothetical protein n=1 Tax=Gallaecimonas mangrovi TaxID=2291597 RepID=UPI000E2052E5|nr:hypothetical protein [Gallaecimonas mangrovi]